VTEVSSDSYSFAPGGAGVLMKSASDAATSSIVAKMLTVPPPWSVQFVRTVSAEGLPNCAMAQPSKVSGSAGSRTSGGRAS
jgi:hypothetical protein